LDCDALWEWPGQKEGVRVEIADVGAALEKVWGAKRHAASAPRAGCGSGRPGPRAAAGASGRTSVNPGMEEVEV
jgi:hypothetical protein